MKRHAHCSTARSCVASAVIVAVLFLASAGRAAADPVVVGFDDPVGTQATDNPAAPSPVTLATLDPPSPPPALLWPLYASYAGLQVTDGYLTWTAVHHGAVEQNVIVKPIAGNAYGLLGLKVGISVATILLIERLRHDHPRAAIFMMVALNSGMSWVVWQNRRWLP